MIGTIVPTVRQNQRPTPATGRSSRVSAPKVDPGITHRRRQVAPMRFPDTPDSVEENYT